MEVTSNSPRKGFPRSLQFQRMERIVKAMQHPTVGVPVRSQKLFLTTVPNAFTGNDITEWIMQKLNVKDSAEALHFASLLCYYGYFFHVTTNGAVQIKEDNELFRFQAPYFWVSTNWTTGNTEYAIYLMKRTLRNRQRHGLEEHEIRALEDLKKKLLHQWDFVTMQAEAQFRVLKDRKKTDKTIIDSQERAFWRVMRPSPDETSVLEMDIRNDLYTFRSMRRDEALKRRLEYLQQALMNRVRTKSSQTHQSLCAFFEVFSDYDPFLGHCPPSNPWLTSDTDRWNLMQPLVENPTQLRVRRWSFNCKELLSDPTGVREFMKFCKAEFSTESLNFYLHVQEIRNCPLSQMKQKAEVIYREHLAPNAPQEVNINDTIRTKIIKQLENPSREMFFEAEKHIIELMKKNSYPRFVQSEQYRNLLQTAPNPVPKKTGIFHFVKDNYFRTSSSSSEDEYDSDDSTHRGENTASLSNNVANKNQTGGTAVATTVNVTAAVTVVNTVSNQLTGSDGNKLNLRK
ncbi:unnamed protein product [Rotaria magnacalcarata]|uniref:Regulator of G-protein signaling 7 n=10 Tax=Rotaria magnacalcarata TaxID=392030 RepID=A0A819CSA9_9BILA|nr:unnamed protein product [Rotaria magnacalcarata]CAF1550266.1 unnamed protein product [Rotaria magnacalcarata]CAF2092085.1 unnamed protein product [Rotaria magnacalcarata]CAF2127785.1 unnamed protein product [Rotaria magnacalcarata]CAF2132387.1 unnamed protein product [Rotaria magnacalcarata]